MTSSFSSVSSPIPYGATNNCVDSGWIWGSGDSLVVDFGKAVAMDEVRLYHVYGGGRRAAEWEVASSDDGSTWDTQSTLDYDADGCGWYDFSW